MSDYVGYRTSKRLKESKKKKAAWKWIAAAATLVALFVILGALVRVYPFNRAWDSTADGFQWAGRKIKGVFAGGEKSEPAEFLEEGKKTANYLLALTRQVGGGTELSTLVLVSYDSRDGKASLIYFPSDLRVQVPGAGEDTLSNLVEIDDGRAGMTLIAVSNLLGVEIDRYVMGSDRDLRIILGKLKPDYEVKVLSKASFKDDSLDASVDLEPGRQELTGSTLASYLAYAPPGKELDLIKRQKSFAVEFLDMSRQGGVYDTIPAFTRKYASLLDTSASDRQLAGLWQTLANIDGSKLEQATVPVKEMRIEKTVMHLLDRPKLEAFKKKYLKSDTVIESRLRVDILNGNGVPGIGQVVASMLDPGKFQVVNNANADNFEHPDTVILVYDTGKEMISAAEQVKNALGVGRIEPRPPGQDVVDITIVVGKDYTGN